MKELKGNKRMIGVDKKNYMFSDGGPELFQPITIMPCKACDNFIEELLNSP